jgi:membrane protein implicated in regulation of membrane protease activity
MKIYWLYEIPEWLFGTLTVAVFVAFGLAGLYLTRRWVQRLDTPEHHAYNHIVGFYFAGVTVLYAVCAGLLAIGAWATYSDVQGKVDHEAAALGALYRDIGAYPEPARSILQQDLRTYTRGVIDVGWPMQRQGIVPNNASAVLNDFQQHFMSYEPQDERQKILASEAYRAFNELTASRRARLNSVTYEMPGPLWALVIIGAAICIAVTWFLHPASFTMHFWMTILFSGLLALLIFLIAVLDNPYRGTTSVSPEPLERVYEQVMQAAK